MTCCFQIASNSPCLKGLTRISPLCPIRVNRCLVTVGAIRTILASEDETRSLACNDGTAFDRSRLKLDATEAAVRTSGRPSGISPPRRRSPSPRRPIQTASSSSPRPRLQSPPRVRTTSPPRSSPPRPPPIPSPPRLTPTEVERDDVSPPRRQRSLSPPAQMTRTPSRTNRKSTGSSLTSSPSSRLRPTIPKVPNSPPVDNRRSSRLQAPKSRTPTPKASPKPMLKKSVSGLLPPTSNLRARLAEAQQLRKTKSGLGLTSSSSRGASSSSNTAGGAAATLRARLEAVRRQQQHSDDDV